MSKTTWCYSAYLKCAL